MITVNELYQNNKLKFSRGRYNILNCGVRTGKTYWAINNLKDFTRDGLLRRILFLTDTISLRDSIINSYKDQCCEVNDFWIHKKGQWTAEENNKIGVMCYQSLGMKVLKDDIDFLDEIDVICWDECDTIFDFAATAFARARKTEFARKTSTNSEILALIQEHSTKIEYMPLVLLGYWEKIINDNRILCIGLSATPEEAQSYYSTLVSASNQGKIQSCYRAANDIYFKNILDHIKELTPVPGLGYWCYSPSIKNNLAIARVATAQGFDVIEIHSLSNHDYPSTPEQKRVIECITNLHIVPYEYNFVIVTRAYERGLDIVDPRFRDLIVDSYYAKDREQAGRQTFPYQRHVKVLAEAIPSEFMNSWLTLSECRELAECMAIPDLDVNNNNGNRSRIMTWNKLKDVLPTMGYTVESKRKRIKGKANPVQCYYITGEWHDIEIKHENDFMELVKAKSNDEILKIE